MRRCRAPLAVLRIRQAISCDMIRIMLAYRVATLNAQSARACLARRSPNDRCHRRRSARFNSLRSQYFNKQSAPSHLDKVQVHDLKWTLESSLSCTRTCLVPRSIDRIFQRIPHRWKENLRCSPLGQQRCRGRLSCTCIRICTRSCCSS